MARPYGLFGANPFGRSFFENAPAGAGDFTLPAGGTITFRHRVLFLAGDFAPAAVEAAYQAFAGWAPLGTGHDLTGWTSRPDLGHWSVSDGVITGANGPEKQGSVLWTDRTFGDFVLETDFRFSGTIDSGVFVKGERYQVNLGISSSLKVDKTCSIYAPEDGLGKYPGEAEGVADLLREGDWNTLRVEARGAHIRVGLNGQPVLDYEAKALPATGPIGLQVHPGLDMKVEFRNPRIRP